MGILRIPLSMILVFSFAAFAVEVDPSKMRVLQCMAAYDFDFVAEELGFTVADVDENGEEKAPPDEAAAEKTRLDQALHFATSGKLTPKGASRRHKPSRAEKDLAHRCQILAEMVIEIMILKGHLVPDPAKSGPAAIDQSL